MNTRLVYDEALEAMHATVGRIELVVECVPGGECQPDGAAIAYADIAPGIVCSYYDAERLTHSHVGGAEHVERGGRPADHRQDRRVRHKLVDAGAESVNQTAERHGSGKGLCARAGRAALAVTERDRDGIARPQRGIAHAQLHDLFPGPHAEIGVKTRSNRAPCVVSTVTAV